MSEGGLTPAPRASWKDRDTEQALSLAFSISVPLPPPLGKEVDTYLIVLGFEFSRRKVLSGKTSD